MKRALLKHGEISLEEFATTETHGGSASTSHSKEDPQEPLRICRYAPRRRSLSSSLRSSLGISRGTLDHVLVWALWVHVPVRTHTLWHSQPFAVHSPLRVSSRGNIQSPATHSALADRAVGWDAVGCAPQVRLCQPTRRCTPELTVGELI